MSAPSTPKRGRLDDIAEESATPRRSSPRRPMTREAASSSQKTPQGNVQDTPQARASSRKSTRTPQSVRGTSPELLPLPSSSSTNENAVAPSSPLVVGARAATMSEIDMSSPLNYGTPSSQSSLRTPHGSRGTPLRNRSDIHSERRVRQLHVGGTERAEGAAATEVRSNAEAAPGPQLVIWGTDIVVNLCKEKFKKFVLRFVNPEVDEDEHIDNTNPEEPLYLQKLEEISVLEEPFFNLNCIHLMQFDADLYRQLVCYPQEIIPTFDMTINEMFFDRYPETQLPHQIQVRPYNAEKTKNMRSLNPEDIDQLITISGMVIRSSNIIPEMREAFFRCNVCQHTTTVEIDRGRIAEPTLCVNCSTNYSYGLIHNRSQFSDKQIVKLQESPDDMPPGQTPHTILLYAHNDLVDAVQPGDRVTVTGIYRAVPLRSNPRQQKIKAVYKTHIDVVHFRKMNSKRLREETENKEFILPPEKLEQVKKLSKERDIYELLARALAPSIYENEDIKKGILLQLFGGTKKDFNNTGRGKFRSEINILLCGDPGTSKSQLLQYVYNIVPRGQYTSGKGSSAVGLTAYVTKDPETKQLVLQTGALVLSDNGVCCIDEFDKMNDSTRSVLHEVMEQQTLSIAKAGIICQLNARTSVLAAANPCESQWNKNKTIIENIQLPPTLLSRFDLIFLMLDPQNETFDTRLARHLVTIYHRSPEENEEEFLSLDILKDYIGYAKANIHPQLSPESGEALIQAYVEMRKIGSGHGQVSAYPRQLESLIRLAEAHAKVRLSNVVELLDVEEARRIHREALKQSATDPSSGKIDISILTTGLSSSDRRRRTEVSEALKKLIKDKGRVTSLSTQTIFHDLQEKMTIKVTRDLFEDALKDLQDEGVLTVVSKSTVRVN